MSRLLATICLLFSVVVPSESYSSTVDGVRWGLIDVTTSDDQSVSIIPSFYLSLFFDSNSDFLSVSGTCLREKYRYEIRDSNIELIINNAAVKKTVCNISLPREYSENDEFVSSLLSRVSTYSINENTLYLGTIDGEQLVFKAYGENSYLSVDIEYLFADQGNAPDKKLPEIVKYTYLDIIDDPHIREIYEQYDIDGEKHGIVEIHAGRIPYLYKEMEVSSTEYFGAINRINLEMEIPADGCWVATITRVPVFYFKVPLQDLKSINFAVSTNQNKTC